SLSGELECFTQGEEMAFVVSPGRTASVTVPFDCFVLHYAVMDGAHVSKEDPLALLRRVG
ncbi:MAG: hypothetical protein ACXVQV_13420, partial [Actinomycetota bacterium]